MSVNLIEHIEQESKSSLSGNLVLSKDFYESLFKKTHKNQDVSLPCYIIKKVNEKYELNTSYFIGVDWIEKEKSAIYVAPKLNAQNKEIDYIKMLFSSLRHPEISKEINELFEIKWDQSYIEISQKRDLLTPFLVVEFLSLLKTIVRKGLKKSYYKVEQNINSKVKGKILISKTIKNNLVQNKSLYTYCSFDEFGLNNFENRLLKKAFNFVKRYLPNYSQLNKSIELQNTFNFISPAFQEVSDEVDLTEIKQLKTNAFYKEYEPAINLAKLILKRFAYNISNTEKTKISTPPFWIDMSKLFELYTLGLLKDRFQNQVKFQHKHYGNELDFLLNSSDYQMVIDAKYKLEYMNGSYNDDIRQVSGYARLRNVYTELNKKQGEIIDCLIIYPDQENGFDNLKNVNLKGIAIERYFDVYKLSLKLPFIN